MDKSYILLKLNRYVKNHRLKNAGVFLFHVFRRRYIGIFFDPVLSCNFRCKMCYFSDPEKRKNLKGKFSESEVTRIADAFFHRAVKLQIGCGAEPSLYRYNKELIQLAKEKKVPYVSMTTNGNLLSEQDLFDFAASGLDEITLSVHGVTKESYEYFMEGGSFDKFCELLANLTAVKKKYPDLKIRINYTINRDNLEELRQFFDVFGSYSIDILQVRPIQEIGQTKYNDFSWTEIIDNYDEILGFLKKCCQERGVVYISPTIDDLTREANNENSIARQTYCNISPQCVWKEEFDLENDTFESFSRKHKLGRKYFKMIFEKAEKSGDKRSLNYDIV